MSDIQALRVQMRDLEKRVTDLQKLTAKLPTRLENMGSGGSTGNTTTSNVDIVSALPALPASGHRKVFLKKDEADDQHWEYTAGSGLTVWSAMDALTLKAGNPGD